MIGGESWRLDLKEYAGSVDWLQGKLNENSSEQACDCPEQDEAMMPKHSKTAFGDQPEDRRFLHRIFLRFLSAVNKFDIEFAGKMRLTVSRIPCR
ncbi:hypothetical protein HNQ77_001615 [Silvibacterium bohemicum]|uniref:Uncharacterized protein n=1 Tax=Silvibacterium bohemicum TaxID=1577686 RepID=A0A841JQQ8_9BACT|nr:hypothetical protein [Silvibacterium bohemicum]MBB6143666.1 hypothetical protein [Silvibacterium bohemicum]